MLQIPRHRSQTAEIRFVRGDLRSWGGFRSDIRDSRQRYPFGSPITDVETFSTLVHQPKAVIMDIRPVLSVFPCSVTSAARPLRATGVLFPWAGSCLLPFASRLMAQCYILSYYQYSCVFILTTLLMQFSLSSLLVACVATQAEVLYLCRLVSQRRKLAWVFVTWYCKRDMLV